MIEYAKVMSSKELKDFFTSISNLYDHKKNYAQSELSANEVLLFQTYYNYENEQIKVFSDQKKDVIKKIDFWNKKECLCGNKLRLIEYASGKFWGCSLYKDTTMKHTTFSTNEDAILKQNLRNCRVRINAHWATDILRRTNLTKSIKAKELIEYYTNYGYEDLREKYGYKSTIESISGYVNAKKNSREEEKEIAQHLSKLFPTKQIQMGINYKLENQNPKVAIIDLILSNNEIVFVVEIKRSNYDIKEGQLELYQSLISFMLKENSDDRKCYGVYLVYNKESYISLSDKTKYVEYDKIRDCELQGNVTQIFMENYQVA